MLSEDIRLKTESNHQLLERKMIKWIKNVQDRKEYAELLNLFYGFFSGLETHIGLQLESSLTVKFAHRRKSSLLAQDIASLDANLNLLAPGEFFPPINNDAQALGALYVLEGSTLGGPHIKAMLMRRLPGLGVDSFTFFTGYGNQTAAMWQAFTEEMNNPYYSPKIKDVIESANATFYCFSRWLDHSVLLLK